MKDFFRLTQQVTVLFLPKISLSSILLMALLFFNINVFAKKPQPNLRVFINCPTGGCDMNYIKTHLQYVDYARDRTLADVEILITKVNTGSNGISYDLELAGRGKFEGTVQKLKYEVPPTHTNDEIRAGLIKRIKLGLAIYLADTPLADDIKISVKKPKRNTNKADTDVVDKWDNWVYRVYGSGNFNKETSRTNVRGEFGFRADRVTEEWRINTHSELNYERLKIMKNDEEVISLKENHFIRTNAINSLNDNWSAGIFARFNHNTYRNIGASYLVGPAIEYSLFPYSEVTKREITFAYRVDYMFRNYIEETIYEKNTENLLQQTLTIRARFNQPWGNISSRLEASNFFHDFSKNSVEFRGNVFIRVFKGFSVRFSTRLEVIRDQLGLPKRDATWEEILLRQRQIATDFEMGFGVGLSYTFGSTYNNVVNTRL